MSILDHVTHPTVPFRETLAHAAVRTIDWFEKNSGLGKAAAVAARLNAMTDAELAELGMTRDEICYHAFRRYMY